MEPSALENFPALYNITPGVNTWIARSRHGQPTLQPYLWGLVPIGSKERECPPAVAQSARRTPVTSGASDAYLWSCSLAAGGSGSLGFEKRRPARLNDRWGAHSA